MIGVVYFIVRILGKYAGAFWGCLITGKDKLVRNYLGLALIPQAEENSSSNVTANILL